MADGICVFPDCGRHARVVRGLCSTHYNQWLRAAHRDPEKAATLAPRTPKPKAACSVATCDRDAIARSLCPAHWRRRRSHGDVDPSRPVRKSRPKGSTQARDGQGRKHCPVCAQWLPESTFSRARGALDGLTTVCKPCQREMDRLARFGLTRSAYEQMAAAQGGCCAICRRSDNPGFSYWHVDHDHACCPEYRSCGDCIRGLLCHRCNAALGMFGDDSDRLRTAIAYLEANRRP